MRKALPLALLVALLAALLATPGAEARSVHLDCGARAEGDGSRARPLASLARANRVTLRPGDRLLLRRGSTCTGTLAPRGSGTEARRVVVASYGRGARPRVVGSGEDAVRLEDRSWVTLQELRVSNPGDGSARRRGVHVIARRAQVTGIRVQRLIVERVGGDLAKDAGGSGGIQLDVLGPLPARFHRVLIERNLVREVSRSGIFIVGTQDPTRPRASEPWPEASTRILVRRNRLHGLAGDGIVPLGTFGAVVEENVVSEGNRAGRSPADPRGLICNAGIWTFHANRTLIQRNEVFAMPFNGCDGTAFDVDYDQDGTVVQFNYSHDNEGGFILLCNDHRPREAEVRFNLSVDDRYVIQQSPCEIPAGFTGTLDGIRMFNNTFVGPRARAIAPFEIPLAALGRPGSFRFANNVVVARAGQTEPFPCGERCSHNLFSGLPPSGSAAVSADPRFEDGARQGRGRLQVGAGFRLRAGSPARGAGVVLPLVPSTDYFGTRFDGGRPPAIGMHQPGG